MKRKPIKSHLVIDKFETLTRLRDYVRDLAADRREAQRNYKDDIKDAHRDFGNALDQAKLDLRHEMALIDADERVILKAIEARVRDRKQRHE